MARVSNHGPRRQRCVRPSFETAAKSAFTRVCDALWQPPQDEELSCCALDVVGIFRARANLARQTDPAACRLRGRRADRHCGARGRRPARRGAGQAGDRRECHGCRRQCRDRARGEGRARRLHAARRGVRHHRHQSEPLRQAQLRSGEGFRADHADRHHAEPAGGAERPAGEERRRACRLCESTIRQAQLRLGRRRHVAASRRRIVQDRGRHRPAARSLSRHLGDGAGSTGRAAHDGVRQYFRDAAAPIARARRARSR